MWARLWRKPGERKMTFKNGFDMTNDDWINDEERMMMGFFKMVVSYMFAATVFALLVCMCSGCSTHKAVAGVSSVRTDTVYRLAVRADTLRVLDSVLVNTYVRGDTVYRVKEVTRWRDRLSTRTDTVYKAALRTDTIRVPVTVERRLTWWERNVEKPLAKTGLVMVVAVVLLSVLWLLPKIRSNI